MTPVKNTIHYNHVTDAFEFSAYPLEDQQKHFLQSKLKAFPRSGALGEYWNLAAHRADVSQINEYIACYHPLLTIRATEKLHEGREIGNRPITAEQASIELSYATDADLTEYDLSLFQMMPFPFQRAGILYGLLKKRFILADDMGVGKTLQALAVAHLSGAADKLIVECPATIKINWQRAIAQCLPHLTCSVWDGKGGDSDVNVIVINYDVVKKHLRALRAFKAKALICDEGHYLKSATSQRSKATYALAHDIERIAILTGTPILNRPVELVSLLTILGRFDEFGGWYEFTRRYCAAYQRTLWLKKNGVPFPKKIWDTSGASNLEQLNQKLRASCMIRRKKSEVVKDLPLKQRIQVVFPIDNRKDYDKARANLIDYVKACVAENAAFLASIKHLSKAERDQAIQVRQAEAAESAERAQQLVMLETLKQLAARGKLAATIEWIEDFLESNEKLIVFANHVEIQKALFAHFASRAARIVAEDSAEQRQAAIDKFVTDETCRVIVCSLASGGQGVDTLQNAASNVVFVEMGWTPALHLQAEDRAHRIGQVSQVSCYYTIAQDTVEETIQTMLAHKQAICESALDGASETRDQSIFNELLQSVQDVATNNASIKI